MGPPASSLLPLLLKCCLCAFCFCLVRAGGACACASLSVVVRRFCCLAWAPWPCPRLEASRGWPPLLPVQGGKPRHPAEATAGVSGRTLGRQRAQRRCASAPPRAAPGPMGDDTIGGGGGCPARRARRARVREGGRREPARRQQSAVAWRSAAWARASVLPCWAKMRAYSERAAREAA